jgi:hypothetical protein
VEAIRSDTGLGKRTAGAVGCKSDFAQRRDGKVARTPARHQLIEGVIHSPARARFVENEDLRALQSLRAGSILPIAIASIELSVVAGEEANLGAATEVTSTIPRPCRKGELKFALTSRRQWSGAGREGGAGTTENQGEQVAVKTAHHDGYFQPGEQQSIGPVASAFEVGLERMIASSAFPVVSRRQVDNASAQLSPFDPDGLGSLDDLRGAEKIEQRYIFFSQLAFFL